MIRAALDGRLGADPVARATRAGQPMVTVSIAVNAGRPGGDELIEWVNVAAFGRMSEELGRHRKGDLLALMGTLTRSTFTGRDGSERFGA